MDTPMCFSSRANPLYAKHLMQYVMYAVKITAWPSKCTAPLTWCWPIAHCGNNEQNTYTSHQIAGTSKYLTTTLLHFLTVLEGTTEALGTRLDAFQRNNPINKHVLHQVLASWACCQTTEPMRNKYNQDRCL